MELAIHGTKQGYKSSFIPNVQSTNALGDMRNGINDENPLGKSVYSLAFINEGSVFTKYTILRDTLRNYATGNIAFSLFLPANRELPGKGVDVKSLLDKLSRYYIDNYVIDNNLNRGESILINENWEFVQNILSEYKEVDKSVKEEMFVAGTKDPAFHYYKSNNELIELFDKPFQEEYIDFKQIYFIDYNLQGASNPLNVLKNSGIEVNPDLSNEYLYLNSFSLIQGLTIRAYFNNQWNDRTGETGKNIIRSKWPVKIYYQIDKRCYEPIVSLEKTASELSEYLEIRGNRINVKTSRFSNLIEIQKNVEFKVVDHQENGIDNVQMLCRNDNYSLKTVVNNKLEFKGTELIQLWTAEVRTDEYSGKKEFTPETDQKVEIKVKEHKTIPLNVKDEEGTILSDFEVRTNLTKKFQRTSDLYFENEQIDSPYQIIVRKEDYKDENIPNFNPGKENSINITLIKKEKKPQGTFLTKLKTILSKPAIIAILVVIVLLIALGIWLFNVYFGKNNQPEDIPLTAQQIKVYVEGESLLLDTLNDYIMKWNSQEKNYIKKKGKNALGEEEVDSSEWKNEWQPVLESIELAILKRNLIDEKKFAELKNQSYSPAQDSFKTVIEKIDITKYDDAKQKLGDVSKLTLSEIAEKVKVLLLLKDLEKEVTPEKNKINENDSKPEIFKPQVTKPGESRKTGTLAKREDSAINSTTEIIEYLRGSELNTAKLEEYKRVKGINANLKNSIQLGLDFWSLDGKETDKNSKTYWNFRERVKKDANFNNSKLRTFLDNMCQSGAVVSYSNQDKQKGLK